MRYVKDFKLGKFVFKAKGNSKIIREITGLKVAHKTKYSTVVIKQLRKGFDFKTFSMFMVLVNLGLDAIESVANLLLGIISLVRTFAEILGSALYSAMRIAGSAILKGVLLPFIGPFAWVVALIIDVGIDVIDWFINLKDKVQDIVEWIIENSWNKISSFVDALAKINK